jgi:hypothetical protein
MPGQRYRIAVGRHFDPYLEGGKAGRHRPFPLLLLTAFVHSLQLCSDIGGHLVRIPPLLFPRTPALRPDGRADVVPREHLTRHLCGLISQSDAGGVQEDLGPARADRYLIAQAAAQCRDQRFPAGLQLAPQATERNADAPVVAHGCTLATLRTGTRTITTADPLPDHLTDALDRIHRTDDDAIIFMQYNGKIAGDWSQGPQLPSNDLRRASLRDV